MAKITIDGVPQEASPNPVVEIRIRKGELRELRADSSVSCDRINGNVSAGGAVGCGDVGDSAIVGHNSGRVREKPYALPASSTIPAFSSEATAFSSFEAASAASRARVEICWRRHSAA